MPENTGMTVFSDEEIAGMSECYPMADSICDACAAHDKCKAKSDHEIIAALATELLALRHAKSAPPTEQRLPAHITVKRISYIHDCILECSPWSKEFEDDLDAIIKFVTTALLTSSLPPTERTFTADEVVELVGKHPTEIYNRLANAYVRDIKFCQFRRELQDVIRTILGGQ